MRPSSISSGIGSSELLAWADVLTQRGFVTFWHDDHSRVATRGPTVVADGPSSDSLHALVYLDPGEIDRADAMEDRR
jgi:hypothetical protein